MYNNNLTTLESTIIESLKNFDGYNETIEDALIDAWETKGNHSYILRLFNTYSQYLQNPEIVAWNVQYALDEEEYDVAKNLYELVEDSIGQKEKNFLLRIAASKGSLEMVDYFAEKGAEVNHETKKFKRTPMYVAAIGGYLDIVQYLHKAGAEIDLSPETKLCENFDKMDDKVQDYLEENKVTGGYYNSCDVL